MKGLTKQFYRAFGFTIASDLYLPELKPEINIEKRADIDIQQRDLVKTKRATFHVDDFFMIDGNSVLFRVPDVALYEMKEGNEIIVYPYQGANEDEVRLYILGTCMGVILLQRKILALHGSAVVIDEKAYVIVGESGAGKSTLAHACTKRGFSLLSDDVIPVQLNENGIPYAIPAYPQQKLWQESLHNFGIEHTNYRPLIRRRNKYAVPIEEHFVEIAFPLTGIIELLPIDEHEMTFSQIDDLERLLTLYVHTYRNFLLEPLDLLKWHFNQTCMLAQQVPMYRLKRPRTIFTANELVDVILTKISEKERVK